MRENENFVGAIAGDVNLFILSTVILCFWLEICMIICLSWRKSVQGAADGLFGSLKLTIRLVQLDLCVPSYRVESIQGVRTSWQRFELIWTDSTRFGLHFELNGNLRFCSIVWGCFFQSNTRDLAESLLNNFFP